MFLSNNPAALNHYAAAGMLHFSLACCSCFAGIVLQLQQPVSQRREEPPMMASAAS